MKCASEDQLAGYLLGLCDEQESSVIRAHLSECPACSQWVAEARSADEMLTDVRRVLDIVGSSDSDQASAVAVQHAAGTGPLPSIDGYDIDDEIGRGGMGVVYSAVQKATKRKVAIKVLLEGPLTSPTARRRFEREVELAAQLDHPNIVRILESGVASGRRYFAMNYVAGSRLDGFAARQKLNLNDKLALFQRICQAVNYAHQRGVIHRDLKPSNILIDDNHQPHLLDFGLAKVQGQTAEDSDALTRISLTGQVLGTLPYMSPEQAGGNHRDVDIRSDVYSLGVILYELLTGRFPYPVRGNIVDIVRNINECPPEKPSSVRGDINDEVETIVLTALAKDRQRRYQSAGNLAGDIERYLAGQPIEAKRDSGWYVTRKLLVRYRFPVGVTAVVIALAITAMILLFVRRAEQGVAQASGILSAAVFDPNRAIQQADKARGAVAEHLVQFTDRYLHSVTYTDRIMGARLGLLINPPAFWQSVESGPLARYGEWLEIAEMPIEADGEIARELVAAAQSGTPARQYVALCLIGQLQHDLGHAVEACRLACATSADPGVVQAAWWAMRRLGVEPDQPANHALIHDDLTGLTFVPVPASEAYRRGSDTAESDRFDDEARPDEGVTIAAFHLSSTEVTWGAYHAFTVDPASGYTLSAEAGVSADNPLPTEIDDRNADRAIGNVTLNSARRYCEWLNLKGRQFDPPRRYRLPTEDEWEYACRGGNPGRFCYGDDEKYAPYFAHCNGSQESFHAVAQRMPNRYGLFDMHGGLWERCESRYDSPDLDPTLANVELWVSKGGAFYSPAVRCRSAQRNYADATRATDYNGLRIVLEWVQP